MMEDPVLMVCVRTCEELKDKCLEEIKEAHSSIGRHYLVERYFGEYLEDELSLRSWLDTDEAEVLCLKGYQRCVLCCKHDTV